MVGIMSRYVNTDGKCLPEIQAWSFAFLTLNSFGWLYDLESESQMIFPLNNLSELKSYLEPARYRYFERITFQ